MCVNDYTLDSSQGLASSGPNFSEPPQAGLVPTSAGAIPPPGQLPSCWARPSSCPPSPAVSLSTRPERPQRPTSQFQCMPPSSSGFPMALRTPLCCRCPDFCLRLGWDPFPGARWVPSDCFQVRSAHATTGLIASGNKLYSVSSVTHTTLQTPTECGTWGVGPAPPASSAVSELGRRPAPRERLLEGGCGG